ncbi:MAG: three-Cys-motif partner protein TcmP [Phototrophicales bacterium]
MKRSFFEEQMEQSLIKSTIVTKYFLGWASVIIQTQKRNEKSGRLSSKKIAYLDLFAGPGRYIEGSDSTPLMILKKAIDDPDLCERLLTVFNDKDENNVRSLQEAISELPGIENLRYQPQIMQYEVGTDMVKLFEKMDMVPTLFFVDPFGYKGLSLKLINSVLKDWGCDGIFFFNYNRIHMGIQNPKVKEHMDALFGEDKADWLRSELDKVESSHDKELMIVETLSQALKDMGGEYVLPFRFKDEKGKRTMHHLIFVSKHFKGYEMMKEVMAKESSTQTQGVPSFEYNRASQLQPLLFSLSRPLDELGDMLLEAFSGQTLSMVDIYKRHNVGTPFIKSNYKKVLWELEEKGLITASKHKAGSFADHVIVTFP